MSRPEPDPLNTPPARKPRSEPADRRPKPAPAARLRVVWAVCDLGGRTVATFEYPRKADAVPSTKGTLGGG